MPFTDRAWVEKLFRLCLSLSFCCAEAIAQQSQSSSPAEGPTFQSNVRLVLVPVVVRDSHGRPIGKLTKDDFQLFDKGKPQTIASFSAVEHPKAEKPAIGNIVSPTIPSPSSTSVTSLDTNPAQRHLIYLFDDVNIRFADLAQVRQAAVRHFHNGLGDGDQAAIYSFSGNPMLEFTSDLAKLENAVSKLRWRPPAGHGEMRCPDVSYYIADLIFNKGDGQAMAGLVHHTVQCTHAKPEIAALIATAAANRELIIGAQATEIGLRTIKRAIRRLSAMPGQRVIVLASPGFFSQSPEAIRATTAILDLAAKSNVIISGLSVRGVIMAEEEEDVAKARGGGRRPQSAASPGNLWLQYRRETARANTDVMRDLAEGTGGIFFHDNNDLLAGFGRAAAAPEFSYILGFSPAELKQDGSFHRIRILLPGANRMSIEARRGYYALKSDLNDRMAAEDIDDALFSQGDTLEIPVVLQTGYSKVNNATTATVKVVAKIEVASLHTVKTTATNKQSLRVVAALFDAGGGYVMGSSELLNLKMLDADIYRNPAVTLYWDFDAAPGIYSVRVVIRESAGRALTAVSRQVTIP